MPATGTTSRPGEASCASSACGSSSGLGGDQHPVVRRAGRHAEHAGLGRPDPRPRLAGAGEVGGAEPDQVRLELDAHHPPLRAGQVREQRGGPPGAAAHVEHPVAGAHLQQPQHVGHRPRLAAGLAVPEVQRAVVRRAPDLVRRQEPRPGHGLERFADGVHASSQPRFGGLGKNIDVRAAYSG